MRPSSRFCHSMWQYQCQELQQQHRQHGCDVLAAETQKGHVFGQTACAADVSFPQPRDLRRDGEVAGQGRGAARAQRGPTTPPGSPATTRGSAGGVQSREGKVAVPSPTLSLSSSPPSSPDASPTYADGFDVYVRDLYLHRLRQERKTHVVKCLAKQHEISPTMRASLILWMDSINRRMHYHLETLFLAVHVLDTFLSRGPRLKPEDLETIGAVCLLLSSKQEEIRTSHLYDVVTACNVQRGQFFQNVKVTERLVLKTLKGRLVVPTPLFFLEYFAFVVTNDTKIPVDVNFSQFIADRRDRLEETSHAARVILGIVIRDYDIVQYRPSLLALATWKVAVELTGVDDQDFRPEKMYITRGQFGCCYRKVKEVALTTHKDDLYDISYTAS